MPTHFDTALDSLTTLARRSRSLLVLSGAGISTSSGIPDYRDRSGQWKRKAPVTLQAFRGDPSARQRYWARSLIGWPMFEQARPSPSHHALAALERTGRIANVITQNVDRLHQAAGSQRVIDLHGRLDRVVCMGCDRRFSRAPFQRHLERLNPSWSRLNAHPAPDGDADLDNQPFDRFSVPDCEACGGLLKPDVVFFGETVPATRTVEANHALDDADALLVVGSSLMVYSGFRFARAAAARGIPVAAINQGRTRADSLLDIKADADCNELLPALADRLSDHAPTRRDGSAFPG